MFLGTTKKKLIWSFPHRNPSMLYSVHQRSIANFPRENYFPDCMSRLISDALPKVQLCMGSALVTEMLLGSTKSFSLSANARKSMPWLAKKKKMFEETIWNV